MVTDPQINNFLKTERIDDNCSLSVYENLTGASECYVMITPDRCKDFSQTLQSIQSGIDSTYQANDLSEETLIFSRFFFSDIANQKDRFLQSDLLQQFTKSACSFVQQPPLTGSDLIVLMYHLKSDFSYKKNYRNNNGVQNSYSIHGRHYNLHFSCNCHSKKDSDPFGQTQTIFKDYCDAIALEGMDLKTNTMRTWLYVKDIDNRYQGMVDARRSFFDKLGMGRNNHSIASTGIEARLIDSEMLVGLDALAIGNIEKSQISYLSAPEKLKSPHTYGVTFERGTKIDFGDRSHYYVSGTASIDKHGNVVHDTDIEKQTLRVIDNINALLASHSASINDMAYLIIYLRNLNHYPYVKYIMDSTLDNQTLQVYVKAEVCRPAWLVEIEGIAITPCETDYPIFF